MVEKNPTMVRAGKRAKAKGDGFERKVANDLMEVFRKDLKDGEEFKRSPMSGGWSKKLKHTFGDLVTPEWFPFVVSCKNTDLRSTGSLYELIIGGERCKVRKWLKEIDKIAKKVKKDLLLIIKISRIGSFVVLKKSKKKNKLSNIIIKNFGKWNIRSYLKFGRFYMIKYDDFIFNVLVRKGFLIFNN